jgi:hypothetical protein
MTYCIDTSSLIHAWRRDYPPDVFQSLWTHLDGLIQAGRLYSPVEVLLELERGGDEIHQWAKAHGEMFLEVDKEVEKTVGRIVDAFPAFLPATSSDGAWADPYVVAFAVTRGWVVVTGEKAAGPGSKRVKIPNVCQELGVGCICFLDLIRGEGWRF